MQLLGNMPVHKISAAVLKGLYL